MRSGPLAAAVIALPAIIALAGLVAAGGGLDLSALTRPYVQRAIWFSATQAFLSTLISLICGALLALALARRHDFPGRSILLALLSTATVLPGIVVVFAIVAIYGRAGWLGHFVGWFGIELPVWLYGLPGILIAHAFQNIPFATRLYLHALERTPPQHHRLAAELGMKGRAIFRHLDWPRLKAETPGLAALVFLLCFISFAIVLALGGGPDRATLEVAIYDALRGEGDFARAATLAIIQVVIGIGLTFLVIMRRHDPAEDQGAARTTLRADRNSLSLKGFDCGIIAAAALFILPPLGTLMTGAPFLMTLLTRDILFALVTSLALGGASALLATALAYAMARGALAGHRTLYGALAYFALAMPPFALVTGLFSALRPFMNVMALGVPMIIFINAIMALPFAYRLVETPLLIAEKRHGRLAVSLGLSAQDRFRFVEWPALKKPLFTASALAAALSIGDFGVIAFFGGVDLITLPLLLYQQLGAYRMQDASATALLLTLLVFLFAFGALKARSHAQP